MDTVSLIFQGDRPTKGTVLASVLVFALVAGTVVIAAFLLIAVFRDMSIVRTKRRLRELEPAVARELPKALTVRRNKTKSTLPGISTRSTIPRAFIIRKDVSRDYGGVSAGPTSTTAVSLKDPSVKRSYTSVWYPGGRDLSIAHATRSITTQFISIHAGREERASTLVAARGDKEAPLPDEIYSHRTSVNKVPHPVRTLDNNPALFASPSTRGTRTLSSEDAHYHSMHVPKVTTTIPHIVPFHSTTAAKFGILKSSTPSGDLIVTHRHKNHRHGQRPIKILKGAEQTPKIHVDTTLPTKGLSTFPNSPSREHSMQMAVSTSDGVIRRDRPLSTTASDSGSSAEAVKQDRNAGATSPALPSNRTHPIHVGSIPVTELNSSATAPPEGLQPTGMITTTHMERERPSAEATDDSRSTATAPAASSKDAEGPGETLPTTQVNQERPDSGATNYRRNTAALVTASSKNETHPIHLVSILYESTNTKETSLREHLRTTQETYAKTRGNLVSTERDPLAIEEPFTDESGVYASRTTKHDHKAFRLEISHTPSRPRDRTYHSTHNSHVRRIRTSTFTTTGAVEQTNGSFSSIISGVQTTSTLYDKKDTSVAEKERPALSTLGPRLSLVSNTSREDNDDSTEHTSHVFVGPGNWNDLAKDDEEGHTHGHIPIPDPDGAKATTVGFPLDVFNPVI